MVGPDNQLSFGFAEATGDKFGWAGSVQESPLLFRVLSASRHRCPLPNGPSPRRQMRLLGRLSLLHLLDLIDR